jgi:hypothetical protein
MSDPAGPPLPYKVVYSQRVRSEFRELHTRAAARGLGREVLEAAKQCDARLHIYPQFGQPLRDLATEGETVWVAIVKPLVVQYVIDDDKRAVFVIVPFKPLPHLGL